MVDVSIKYPTPAQRHRARIERVRKAQPKPGIRVEPKNDDMRRVLYHPRGRIKFRSEGSIEWPNDTFTHNRIRDGDVIVVQDKPKAAAAPKAAALATPPARPRPKPPGDAA
jgi:hypothetical protein